MELSYEAVCFDLFGTLVEAGGRAVDGAAEALSTLPRSRWAIVTSCGGEFARALLESAGLPLPENLIGADDVTRGKPAAEPYLRGAQALGVAPERVLCVEDSRDGIAAGRAAGMDVLAILHGRGLAFAREASFQIERFGDATWSVHPSGITVSI